MESTIEQGGELSPSTTPVYFSCICRHVEVQHDTGIILYSSCSQSTPVGQFISASPLTPHCPSFSFQIINPGENCFIAIGLCNKTYAPDRQPGWDYGSIGYHADDGGIFKGSGFYDEQRFTCTTNDIMKCELDFDEKNVTFYKNGEKVYTSEVLHNFGNLHAAVGLHSVGEAVKLIEREPWQMASNEEQITENAIELYDEPDFSTTPVYFSSICREVTVWHDTGIVAYTSRSPSTPVGQFISAAPLTPQSPYFTFQIINPGEHCYIAIGLCNKTYARDRQPGWDYGSIGYHADDGGIYIGEGFPDERKSTCTTNDIMKCELNFDEQTATFYKNGERIYTSGKLYNFKHLHAAVGLHSVGEAVRLIEREPWQMALNNELCSENALEQYDEPDFSTPPVYFSCICREVTVWHDTGIVAYSSPSPSTPVGQFISASPLTPEFPSFSFQIINPGQHCYIAIGLCNKIYTPNSQPGWNYGSIGYHADDGGIYIGGGFPDEIKSTCTTNDIMKCELNFNEQTATFYKNGESIYTSGKLYNFKHLHAAVGLHSVGEAVRLIERKPWQMAHNEISEHQTSRDRDNIEHTTDILVDEQCLNK